jgi:3-hydroxyisobutyrate dehydrogenase
MGTKFERIAYLGMGIMGASMAVNMAKAGLNVTVWNRTPGKEGARRAEEAGAQVAASISEAVSNADLIFLCLSDVPDLEAVVLGESGVLASAKNGAILVDMSTTGPSCAEKMAGAVQSKGMHFLDAPVSGGDVGARNGTLTIMVGGEKEIFDACVPVFEKIGKNISYCGPSGSGQAIKLCNQILCAVNMLAVCESLKLAETMGLDPQMVVDVCSPGAGGSWALSNLGPRIVKGDLEPGFMIKDMQKDLRLVREVLQNSFQFPASELADKRFSDAIKLIGDGGAAKGTQAMSTAYGINQKI